MKKISNNILPFISVSCLAHFMVDASCVLMLSGFMDFDNLVIALLLYNALAFLLELPFGFLIDKKLNPKLTAVLGLILVAMSFFLVEFPYLPLIIIAIGNAMFHVGTGSLVLSLSKKRATYAGILIAPGAIGLAFGGFIANYPLDVSSFVFPAVLLLLSTLTYFIQAPDFIRSESEKSTSPYYLWIIVLIFVPIVVRSLVGLSISFPWKSDTSLNLILIASVAMGKVFGGVLSDRYGMSKIGVGGLLLSMPLLAFFSGEPIPGIIGIFLFNLTMPITLIAISEIIPKYKGLAFGLTTSALYIGSLPVLLKENSWVKSELSLFVLILFASIVLFWGLKLKNKVHEKEE